jgi:hypothetical protein
MAQFLDHKLDNTFIFYSTRPQYPFRDASNEPDPQKRLLYMLPGTAMKNGINRSLGQSIPTNDVSLFHTRSV